jgi:hypothetical protein
LCEPGSPIAIWRAAEAVSYSACWALALLLRAGPRWRCACRLVATPLGRHRLLVTGPVALVVGPVLARPFFGPIDTT